LSSSEAHREPSEKSVVANQFQWKHFTLMSWIQQVPEIPSLQDLYLNLRNLMIYIAHYRQGQQLRPIV
jgi:hypothetical protein